VPVGAPHVEEHSATLSKSAKRRWARRVLIAFVAVLGVFAAATAGLLVWPPQGMPARADAIVMLAGPGDRLPVAVELAREGRAPVLVVSRGHLGYGGPCPAAVPGVTLICFDPNPADTRGEAEYIAKLARRAHWRSIAVVATPEQDLRARLIVGRCYPGTISVVTAPVPWSQLPYQVAYGWAALFKAVVLQRSC
jgi:uncharacterized SAM-binding protein YcdF (DUF218 family)